jgi:hypothetical protein
MFFHPILAKSGMNYQSRFQRDLNALGSLAQEQAAIEMGLTFTMLKFTPDLMFCV